jgi:REP element-mobilizing transposase RayT
MVTPEIERDVYRLIESEARSLDCSVLAIGGMPDHVHLVVKVPGKVSASDIAHKVKGVSSKAIKDRLGPIQGFKWQSGYGAFSIGRNQVSRVIAYVENQKQHHSEGSIHPEWEETDEEYVRKEQ